MVTKHGIAINIYTLVQESTGDAVMGHYVTIPPALGEKTRAGVVFYLPDDPSRGEQEGNLVLDRLVGQEQGLILKVNAAFDSSQVPFNTLAQRIDEYITRHLNSLGLALVREDG